MELPEIIIQPLEEKYNPPFQEVVDASEEPTVTDLKGIAIVEDLINRKGHGINIWSRDDQGNNYLMQISGSVLYHIMGKFAVSEAQFKELKDQRDKRKQG